MGNPFSGNTAQIDQIGPDHQSRRTVESFLEAPDLLNSVLPVAASDHLSRLGPAVEERDGVFQKACLGKYNVESNVKERTLCHVPSPIHSPSALCRRTVVNRSRSCNHQSPPECSISNSTLEAPSLSTIVAPKPPAYNSRSGPVCGMDDGIFRTPIEAEQRSLFNNDGRKKEHFAFVRQSSQCAESNCHLLNERKPYLRRTVESFLEAPDLLNSVLPHPASDHLSRLSPAVEERDGVFQIACIGKYNVNLNVKESILRDAPSPICSSPSHHCSTDEIRIHHHSSPECTISTSTVEAPSPPITVELSQPAHSSHSGPVYGVDDGVFQTPIEGKYDQLRTSNLPVNSSFSSADAVSQSAALRLPSLINNVSEMCPIIEEPQSHVIESTINCRSTEVCVPSLSSDRSDSSVGHPPPAPSISNTPSTHCSLDGLRVYYQNVHGLRTKVDDFFAATANADYDVIILTETWLDDRIYSAQLFGNRFTVFRNDRNPSNSNKVRGGGVLIAVCRRFSCSLDSSLVSSSVEQVWVKIKLPGRSISIGAVYLPPDRKTDMVYIDNHINSIGAVLSRLSNNDLALLCGDYNQSGLVWNVHDHEVPSIDVLRSNMPLSTCTLLDGFDFHGLVQISTILNRNSRMLDLLLVNEVALSDCSVSEALVPLIGLDADHPALEIAINVSVPILYEDIEDPRALDFSRADFDSMTQALMQVDWSFLDTCSCVDEAVDKFTHTMSQIIADHVPQRRPTPKPVWGNARLRHLKRLRSKALRKYSVNKNAFTKRFFALASNDYRSYNRYLYKRYTRRIQYRLRRNPKAFWSFVKTKKNEEGLPAEIFLNERHAHSALDKCNLLADRFKQVFNNITAAADQVDQALCNTPSDVFSFNVFTVTPDMVESAINKLKHSNVGGPDNIPPCILKKCTAELILPLVKLFNFSLLQRTFPERWKFSFMFPVFKKGDKQNAENYRGITSLCACSKVLEIIVYDAFFGHCKIYISPDQHGFYPKRSITTNLAPFISLCLRNMESGAQVDVIYTDLKAAFDRVDHSILLGKLGKLGVSPNLVQWFKSYLTNRKLCVRIGSAHSDYFTNSSGIPQGSNLGPLLFSIFLNDVGFVLPDGCRILFADDVKIFVVVRCLADCLQLQELINDFSEWCCRNFVTLSVHKCNSISFHRKQKPILFDYTINSVPLQHVEVTRDLGILLDSALTFKPHYCDIVARASRQLGFIFKIADEFRDPLCLKALYCSLVRSLLEFGSVIWCPYQRVWISRLESIQKKFVRYTLRHLPWNDPNNLPPYEHRCQLLGIDTLEHRRSIAQAVFVAKVLVGEIDSPGILADLQLYAPERPLRTRNFLHLPARVANYGLHDPVRYMSARFNEYYEVFDFNCSVLSFRNRIERLLHEEIRLLR